MSDFTDAIDALTVADLQAKGSHKWTRYPGVIGAWVAELDFGLAPAVRAAIDKFITTGLTGYTPQNVREDLRLATSQWLANRYSWIVDPQQVFGMPDVLSILDLTLSFLARPGKVIVPTPAYMPFLDFPAAHGRELVQLPMIATPQGWLMDYDGLDREFTNGASVLVLCNPHNPIGKMYTRDELERICQIVEHHHGIVFNDEIHAPLTYDGNQHIPYPSINPSAAAHTVTGLSASKSFNIAGLKCAQVVLTNPDHQAWVVKHAHGLPYSAAGVGAAANIAAYREGGPWLAEVLGYLQRNRDVAVQLVHELMPQVDVKTPQATFLLFLDTSKLGLDSPFEHFLAAGVATNDGITCGDVCRNWVRFNFGMPTPIVAQAIQKMAQSLA